MGAVVAIRLDRRYPAGGEETGAEAGLDEILTLDREQPELVAPAPLVQLAEQLEPLVVA